MPKQILVVEDDKAIRESLIELLEGEGYRVVPAENGQMALDYLCAAKELPNLILLDLMMPIKDGFGFCTDQAKDARISHVPVVIMSADGRIQQKQEKSHARDYIRKPVDIDVMLEMVAKYCT